MCAADRGSGKRSLTLCGMFGSQDSHAIVPRLNTGRAFVSRQCYKIQVDRLRVRGQTEFKAKRRTSRPTLPKRRFVSISLASFPLSSTRPSFPSTSTRQRSPNVRWQHGVAPEAGDPIDQLAVDAAHALHGAARESQRRVDKLANLTAVGECYRFFSAPRRSPDNLGEDRSTCIRVNSMNVSFMTLNYDDFWGNGPRRTQIFLYSISAPHCKIVNFRPEWYEQDCVAEHSNASACHRYILDNFEDLQGNRVIQVGVGRDFGEPGVPFLKCLGRPERTFQYMTDLMVHQSFWAGGSFHIELQSSKCLAVPLIRNPDWEWGLFQVEPADHAATVVAAIDSSGWVTELVGVLYGIVSISMIVQGIFAAIVQSKLAVHNSQYPGLASQSPDDVYGSGDGHVDVGQESQLGELHLHVRCAHEDHVDHVRAPFFHPDAAESHYPWHEIAQDRASIDSRKDGVHHAVLHAFPVSPTPWWHNVYEIRKSEQVGRLRWLLQHFAVLGNEIICDLTVILSILTLAGFLGGSFMLKTKYKYVVNNNVIKLLQQRYVLVGWDMFVAMEALGIDVANPNLLVNGVIATNCSFGAVIQQLYTSGPSGLVHLAGDYLFEEGGMARDPVKFHYHIKKATEMGLCKHRSSSRTSAKYTVTTTTDGRHHTAKESKDETSDSIVQALKPKNTTSLFDRRLQLFSESRFGRVLLVDESEPGKLAKNATGSMMEFVVQDALSFLSILDIKPLLGNEKKLRIS
ncbi:hypothetical protein FI667_g15356, partial [Globisporangium splendens]